MPPIIPTSKAKGHIIVAKIKNTGSSPRFAQKPSPKSFIKSAYTRLWSTEPTTMPIAEAPVRIKNTFEILVNFAFAAKTMRAIPRQGNIIAAAKNRYLLNRSIRFMIKMFDMVTIKKASVIQKITTVEV